MATYNGSVTSNTSHFGCYLVATESNVNTPNNTSVVKADLHITRSQWGWQTGTSHSGNIIIDGTSYSFSYSPNWPYASSGDVIVGSASKTVTHNDEGKKTCAVSGTWNASGSYSCGTARASGNLVLSTIARASTPYCPDFNIGSSAIINIARASASFTHTLKYTFGSLSDTIVEKTSELNIGWQAPVDFFGEIPNAQSGKGTIICDTYSGNTLIGTKSTTFTAHVVDSGPEVEVLIQDSREDVITITKDKNKLIRHISTAEVTVTATAKNGASISSYKIKNGSKTINDDTLVNTTFNFEKVENNEFEIIVTDSRGITTTITKTTDIYNYTNPVITNVEADRLSSDSPEISASLRGQWYKDTIGSKANTLTGTFYYTQDGGDTWSPMLTLSLQVNGNEFSFNGSLGTDFNPDKDIEIMFEVNDGYLALTQYASIYTINLPKGIPLIDIGENDVNINGDIKQNGESILVKNIVIGEEIATNEYINGKRVYKKMYEIGAMTGTVLSVAHGLTGYDLLWIDQSNTWFIAPDGAIGPLPFHNAHNANYAIEFYLSNAGKNIFFYSANQRISKAYVTLKYTK